MYYYKRRYYSPVIGRFLQPDPAGQNSELNLYTYALNSPLILSDPDGTLGVWIGYNTVGPSSDHISIYMQLPDGSWVEYTADGINGNLVEYEVTGAKALAEKEQDHDLYWASEGLNDAAIIALQDRITKAFNDLRNYLNTHKTPYTWVPGNNKQYNSNSAASTILNHVGIRIPNFGDFIPGYGNDLPVWA